MSIKDEITKCIDDYFLWLKDKTILKTIDDSWMEITTPYLDRHNDCLQIYVKKDNRGYLLTDDGYIINNLSMSGCSLNGTKLQKTLKIVLASYGIQLQDKELFVRANKSDFSIKKHSLVQAMLAVNDLFYIVSPHVTGVFFEDVEKWMNTKGIRYTPYVNFAGKSGYNHQFDIVIPKSSSQPERIIQLVNHPKKNSVESLVFKWMDTRETRSSESRMIALMNNSQTKVSETVIDALTSYDIQTILWTQHEEAEKILSA